MKTKKLLIAFFMLLFTCSAISQSFNSKEYIYLPNSYSFCMDNPDIGIQIPANWGFKVSSIKHEDEYLYILANRVSYYTPYENDCPHTVLFVKPEGSAPCLELRLSYYNHSKADSTAIESDFGTFQRVTNTETTPIESYQYVSNSRIITFRILASDEADKKLCREIIAKAQDCYYSVDVADISSPELNNFSISYYANDSTYYPNLGLTFVTPFNIQASLTSDSISINEATTLLTAKATLKDLSGEDAATFYTEDNNFVMQYRFYDNQDYSLEDIENNLTYDYEDCMQKFTFDVNNLESTFYLLGSDASYKNLLVIVPTQTYYAVFRFDKINAFDNAQKMASIIDQLVFSDSTRQEETYSQKESINTLVNQMNIQSYAVDNEFKNISLKQNITSKKLRTLTCEIPSIGATVYMPVFEKSVQLYPGYDDLPYNKKKKSYLATLSTESSSYSEDNSYAVLSEEAEDTEAYSLIIVLDMEEEGISSVEEYALDILEALRSDASNCEESDIIVRLGKTQIGDKTWYVISGKYRDNIMHLYLTEHNGKVINLRANDSEDKSVNLSGVLETMLYKAKFK